MVDGKPGEKQREKESERREKKEGLSREKGGGERGWARARRKEKRRDRRVGRRAEKRKYLCRGWHGTFAFHFKEHAYFPRLAGTNTTPLARCTLYTFILARSSPPPRTRAGARARAWLRERIGGGEHRERARRQWILFVPRQCRLD